MLAWLFALPRLSTPCLRNIPLFICCTSDQGKNLRRRLSTAGSLSVILRWSVRILQLCKLPIWARFGTKSRKTIQKLKIYPTSVTYFGGLRLQITSVGQFDTFKRPGWTKGPKWLMRLTNNLQCLVPVSGKHSTSHSRVRDWRIWSIWSSRLLNYKDAV